MAARHHPRGPVEYRAEVVRAAHTPSPVCLNNQPLCFSTASRNTSSWVSSAARIASGSASQRRVEPSISVNRNVTTPRGRSRVLRTAVHPDSLRHARRTDHFVRTVIGAPRTPESSATCNRRSAPRILEMFHRHRSRASVDTALGRRANGGAAVGGVPAVRRATDPGTMMRARCARPRTGVRSPRPCSDAIRSESNMEGYR